jgi:type VI secretion system protein VasG
MGRGFDPRGRSPSEPAGPPVRRPGPRAYLARVRVDPKALVRRLDPLCQRALESAVLLAVSRQHYEVTVEHVVRKLLDETEGDLPIVFRHFEVHPPRLVAAVEAVLEGMTRGNTGRPVFSPLLFTWIEDATLLATIEMGLDRVRSGHLLTALVERPGRTGIVDHTDELFKVDGDRLRRELLELAAGSSEESALRAPDAPLGAGALRAAGGSADEAALSRFTIDVTARARAGEIDPVRARDAEIRQMVDVLTRRRKNNPILIGEAGVGKTAVVEGFALRLVADDVPEPLRGTRILNLDLGLLQAGAGVKGEFENRLKEVLREVDAALVPTIVFIDEAHTLIGAGGPKGGTDAAQLLKPALARGELRTIAATTFSEYKKYIEKDPALERRFQPIVVEEPSVAEALVMLRGVRAKFEAHHGVHLLDEAVEAAVHLSDRFITGRHLPDKAVDLLDTACARVAVGQSSKPGALDDLERRLEALDTALAAMDQDATKAGVERPTEVAALEAERAEVDAERVALEKRWTRQRDAVAKVWAAQEAVAEAHGDRPKARKKLDAALRRLAKLQAKAALVHLHVDADVVAQVVSDWTGIPVGSMVKDEVTRLLHLERDLRRRVVGQDAALEAIATRLRAAKVGLAPPKQPLGVFLLVGPSGVGKTETGLALAELLFGGERFVVTVNMSEFMEKHTVSRLIGSPPGYVGYGEGGVLTEAVRHRPYSVVLLDEVEKAHPEVLNLFHQVFDKGMLADGEGRVVSFENTVIVMTSNLGTGLIERAFEQDEPPHAEALQGDLRQVLQQHFRPALLGRMTVVPYRTLSDDILRAILDLKVDRIRRRLAAEHGLSLKVTRAAKSAVLARCQDRASGARALDRVLDQTVLPRISQELLAHLAGGDVPSTVTLGATRNALTFRFGGGPPSPAR